MDHVTMVHNSNSLWDNLPFKDWAKLKNVLVEESLFCSFPLTRAHTFRAKGHCHRMWRTVSSLEPHTAHLGSMGTRRRAKFARVGRISELACQTKFRTLGGIDNCHSRFHTGLSSCTLDHSSGVLLDKQFVPRTFGTYFHSISAYPDPLNSPAESAELHIPTL